MKLLIAALIFSATSAIAQCQRVTYAANSYTLCSLGGQVTSTDNLRLWHSDDMGNLLGGFAKVSASLNDNQRLAFAMNAGMYHADQTPVGLYVEQGKQKTPLVVGPSYGNFGMVPNGVFCIREKGIWVIETIAFKADPSECIYASQSGPMLVIDGDLHPRFLPNSDSKHIRNGVGTSSDGTQVVFAISNQPVNFHSFASLFRDHLKLPNALYFDGSISRLYAPEIGRNDFGVPLGPIVGLVVPVQKAP